ncbi:DUF389 domain-containing protein [Hymenobacter antarcticus]|uniref:Uncharacterized protein n=1 Tax=Hymenobacter antarcticus TaxID=486270 RepID=A0ABP7PT39_9BACT
MTSETASIIAPAHKEAIDDDRDEAIWEEMESGLRHQGRIGVNYMALMALGGLICAVGLVSEPMPQAVAFIASAIIAPGFDPLAKLPLALVLRRGPLFWHGLRSALAGYAVLILAAGATFYALLAAGETIAAQLAANPEVSHLQHPGLMELLLSGAGAVAGVLTLAAFRRSFQAGPGRRPPRTGCRGPGPLRARLAIRADGGRGGIWAEAATGTPAAAAGVAATAAPAQTPGLKQARRQPAPATPLTT